MTDPDSDTAPDLKPASAFSPFRFPVFRNVWAASMFSNVGGQIQAVGAAWMMVSIGEPPDMVALVQASAALPIVLLALVAGAMADNLDRRRVMLFSQISMFAVSCALAACAWTGLITPWLLLFLTFLIGCGAAFNAPAWQASVGDMVSRAEVAGAVALNSAGFNIARSVGPAIGGALVAAAGAAAAFTLNAVSYVPLVGVIARWRPPPEKRLLPRETLGIAIAAGIRYIAMSPANRIVLVRTAAFGFAASAIMALMPLMASHLIAGGPLTFGLLLGAFGVGAVAGAISVARLRKVMSTEAIVRCASLGFALAAATAGLSNMLALTMAALLIAGAGWVLALSTFNVAVQMSVPRWVVARALSLYQMATFGGMAAGSWLWGVVATSQGVDAALLYAASVMLAFVIVGFWLRLEQLEALNLDPLRVWNAPATAVPVEPTTGPVVVTVEYVIHETDVLEFLAAMAQRRRIRRRDGALNWRLLRDLSDSQVWLERYESPTWLEYIRLNNRMTHDDASIQDRVRALHRGEGVPKVRRLIERQTGGLPGRPRDVEEVALAEPVTDPTRAS